MLAGHGAACPAVAGPELTALQKKPLRPSVQAQTTLTALAQAAGLMLREAPQNGWLVVGVLLVVLLRC